MIEILFFGQTADVTGAASIAIDDLEDTAALQRQLHAQFPDLEQTTYRLAVNKRIITENTPLEKGATVALLPPFSGG